MADQAQTPPAPESTPEASHTPETSHSIIEDHFETAQVRRSPKYSVFLLLGAGLGLIVAMILTFAFDGTKVESANTGMVYSQGQVFGFLALLCIPAGIALFGLLAILLDRTVGRRTRQVDVDREKVWLED